MLNGLLKGYNRHKFSTHFINIIMKKILSIFVLLLFVQLSFAQESAEKGIEKACMNYIEGFYEGDTIKLQKALKPDMYKIGFWKSKKTQNYESQGQMTYREAMDYAKKVLDKKEFPHKEAIKKVEILDVAHHTAAAKVTAWWGTDYMLLSKEGEVWMIEQVLWEGPLDKVKK